MNFSSAAFPHPILNVYNDDIKGSVGLHPDITSNLDNYIIAVKCEYVNLDFTNLINSEKAEFFCEATCSNTLYRKIFTSNNNVFNFHIPRKAIKGKVNFLCMLIAKIPMENYTNIKAHPDYTGYTFEIEKGDVLAYFGEFHFNADINYEKVKAVSSFMEVVENKDEKMDLTNVDLNKSKIEIQLPSEDYKRFASDSISKDPKFASVFHSSIVLNALLMALYNFETHKEFLWAKVIEYRLKNEKQFVNISIDERENIPEIAQRLLGNPFRRLISELEAIADLSNETED